MAQSSSGLVPDFDSGDPAINAYVRRLIAEKLEVENKATEHAQRISELEHRLRESERREAVALKERAQAVKDLETHKKLTSVDHKTVEQLKSQLQEEHTTNAGHAAAMTKLELDKIK
ncbi:hypothetical protein HK405_003229 [Cladochytrium tenue]|nr:hypothetical protein HK405_003229 [Cladochytrium tenue]